MKRSACGSVSDLGSLIRSKVGSIFRLGFGLSVLVCGVASLAQSQAQSQAQPPAQSPQQSPAVEAPRTTTPEAQQPPAAQAPDAPPPAGHEPPSPQTPETATPASPPPPDQQPPGQISGTVLDATGAVVVGARVTLLRPAQAQTQSPALSQEVRSGDNGQFSFTNVAPGPFQIRVTAQGFRMQTSSGTLQPGQAYIAPTNWLVPGTTVEVQVGASQVEIAEEQIKIQEQQRVLGFVPNFYVSYVPDAAPLVPRQKFQLAWRTAIDPITFALNGAEAGVQQADGRLRGYGQGAQGYAKRFAAGYADTVTAIFLGDAVFPTLFRQDPRYFYRGPSHSKGSRIGYAIANAVITKGDNGRWQPNYSSILGNLASGGISNLYYPKTDRGVALTFENAAIRIGSSAVVNLVQEFLVKKLTPHLPHNSHPEQTEPDGPVVR